MAAVHVSLPSEVNSLYGPVTTTEDCDTTTSADIRFPEKLPPVVRRVSSNNLSVTSSWGVSSVASTEKCRELARKAEECFWKLKHEDIELERVLSTTLKSCVQLGRWNGTRVVMKTLLQPADSWDPDAAMHGTNVALTDELLHEVETLSAIRHPDLVLFLGACLDMPGPLACVMEYMPGGDLENFYKLKRQKHQVPAWHPNVARVAQWACAVARALSFLHERTEPIVHRDLKPMNLLLTKHLDVKVADLGISRVLEAAGARDGYTMTGGVGTLRYMAPEVVCQEQYSEKADIYAFALILYFLSSGRQPFHHQSCDPDVILKDFLAGKEPRPCIAECPPKLQRLIEASWHVEHALRPSAQAMLNELEKLEEEVKPSCL